MDWIYSIQRGIDYMEAHLTEKLDYQDIARQAYSSVFQFQRVFSLLCGYTVGEYIRARRLTLAGCDLAAKGAKVIDIALKYGYDSPESFTRAFVRFHGITPSQAKKSGAKLKSFSRLTVKLQLEGGSMMDYKLEKHPAFKIVGKKKMIPTTDQEQQNAIPAFWDQVQADGTLQYLHSAGNGTLLGICRDTLTDEKTFAYVIGTWYDGKNAVPETMLIDEIPARTWVRFRCKGAMPQAIQQLWSKIYTEFFPVSEYEPDGSFDMEVYPDGNMDSPDYESEIWVPVKKRGDVDAVK